MRERSQCSACWNVRACVCVQESVRVFKCQCVRASDTALKQKQKHLQQF